MLDRGDGDALGAEGGRQARVGDVLRGGLDLNGLVEVHAAEDDASVHRGGPQRQQNLFAGMEADAGRLDDVLQRSLSDQFPLPQAANLDGSDPRDGNTKK